MLRVEFGWFGRGGAQVGRLQVCVWRVEQAERKRWGMQRDRKASPAVVCARRRVLRGSCRATAEVTWLHMGRAGRTSITSWLGI